jgi:hypothetical protein
MLRLDRSLVDRFLDEAPADEAVYGINQYLGPRDFNEPDFGMTRPEFNLRLFCIYAGEVGNGGHAQFFLNPSGGLAGRTLEALREMGLGGLSEILRDACSVFARGPGPASQDEREFIIGAFPPEAWEAWGRLDQRLYEQEPACFDEVLGYLRRNRMQILRPETA